MRRQRYRRGQEVNPLGPGPRGGPLAFELCRLEYEELRLEVRSLAADINQNYKWVMATLAAMASTRFFGSSWDALLTTLKRSPGILLALAIALLWFAAFDLSRWSDMKVALRYMRGTLLPRMKTLAMGDDAGLDALWDGFRTNWQHRYRLILLPMWIVKLSLPYMPGGAALTGFIYIINTNDIGWSRWMLLGVSFWVGLAILLLGCLLWTAVMWPARTHSVGSRANAR